jgi:hypothetical protein
MFFPLFPHASHTWFLFCDKCEFVDFGLLDAPAGCFSARTALRGTLSATVRPKSGMHATCCFCSFCVFLLLPARALGDVFGWPADTISPRLTPAEEATPMLNTGSVHPMIPKHPRIPIVLVIVILLIIIIIILFVIIILVILILLLMIIRRIIIINKCSPKSLQRNLQDGFVLDLGTASPFCSGSC